MYLKLLAFDSYEFYSESLSYSLSTRVLLADKSIGSTLFDCGITVCLLFAVIVAARLNSAILTDLEFVFRLSNLLPKVYYLSFGSDEFLDDSTGD